MIQKTNESPFLLARNGPLQGQSWPIKNELIIGREPGCDIVIDDRQVSRRHVHIQVNSDSELTISDLNSKNGTLVNGDSVNMPTTLKDGDEIIVGLVQEFMFISSDATLPLGQGAAPLAAGSQKLFIDQKARQIWVGEKELVPPLSVSQYDLLVFLYGHQGSVVKREEVIAAVWGQDEAVGVTEQALDALIRRLRDRLKKADPTHEYIITLRGVGFKLENEVFA